jgi:glycosyltransferase involved in cell wall biosynthesis
VLLKGNYLPCNRFLNVESVKMKIVFFVGQLASGGAERQLINMSTSLAEMGHEVMLLTVFSGGVKENEINVNSGVKMATIWNARGKSVLARALQLLLAPFRIRRYLRQIEFDCIYSMLYMSNLLAWLATRGKHSGKLVWGLRSAGMQLNLTRRVLQKICAVLSPSVPLMIANSKAGLSYHESIGYHAQRGVCLVNAIDTQFLVYCSEKREAFRRDLGISDSDVIVGMVARLDEVKGHGVFIESAALICNELANVRFVCVGGGSGKLLAKLEEYVRMAGLKNRFFWLGYTDDVRDAYSGFDLLVSPSWSEGFSNVIAEAMSCGLRCVVSNVGESAEIVIDQNLVVEPGDAAGFASVIMAEIRRLPHHNRKEIRSLVVTRYSKDMIAAETAQQLSSIKS